jgi:hypothetical protein
MRTLKIHMANISFNNTPTCNVLMIFLIYGVIIFPRIVQSYKLRGINNGSSYNDKFNTRPAKCYRTYPIGKGGQVNS